MIKFYIKNNKINAHTETSKNYNMTSTIINSKVLKKLRYNDAIDDYKQLDKINCVLKDMIGLTCMWRQIRGYPSGGATTHTNSNSSKKNKILLNFRLDQFNKLFGKKKRNIYPTLIKAEYNNRLWYNLWWSEWKQASNFVSKMLQYDKKQSSFNPAFLANNQTNGYKRIGKASKIGKAKKLTKVFTIGLPVFFSRFIFYDKIPRGLDKKLILKDDVNKSLGKKK